MVYLKVTIALTVQIYDDAEMAQVESALVSNDRQMIRSRRDNPPDQNAVDARFVHGRELPSYI